MNNYIGNTINAFLESILSAQQKFKDSKEEIDQKVSSIETILSNFYATVQGCSNRIKEAGGGEVGAQAHAELQRQLNSLKEWREQIDLYRKGITFISKFEESCIVVVYGKVKAGKSTLGNFIRGKQIAASNLKTRYRELKLPSIEVYDQGLLTTADELHEIDEADEFGVKSTEATRVIQLFTLGGLSWVDTPGIGSITTENEKLAKEYVQNADLVLYLTNSDAAGAQQDFQELKSLKESNKPICLVVTRCDQVEEDEDASGNIIKRTVPKPEQDILAIENWIIEEAKKFNIGDILNKSSILFISVKLAQDAIEQSDANIFRASNINRLYARFAEIMKDEAIEYKIRNPQAKMNSLIDDILHGRHPEGLLPRLDGLHALQKIYEDLLKIVEQKNQESRQIVAKSAQILRSTGNRIILEIVDRHDAAISTGRTITQSLEIEINEALETESKKILENEIKKLIADFQTEIDTVNFNRLQGGNKIERTYETVTWNEQHYARNRRDPSGLWENVSSFCFGTEYHSTSSRYVTRSKQIEVGTNAASIAGILLDQFVKEVIPSFEIYAQSLGKNYFTPLNEALKSILEAAKKAESSLQRCRF